MGVLQGKEWRISEDGAPKIKNSPPSRFPSVRKSLTAGLSLSGSRLLFHRLHAQPPAEGRSIAHRFMSCLRITGCDLLCFLCLCRPQRVALCILLYLPTIFHGLILKGGVARQGMEKHTAGLFEFVVAHVEGQEPDSETVPFHWSHRRPWP